MKDATSSMRAYVTCAARVSGPLAPLLDEVEQLLHEMGWRTRLSRGGSRLRVALPERTRLRADARAQVERATCVIHVAAGASLEGMRLHRELSHAVKQGLPVIILHGTDARTRLDLEMASPSRLASIAKLTKGSVVENLADLPKALDRIAADEPK